MFVVFFLSYDLFNIILFYCKFFIIDFFTWNFYFRKKVNSRSSNCDNVIHFTYTIDLVSKRRYPKCNWFKTDCSLFREL